MNQLPPPNRYQRQPTPQPRRPLHLRHLLWLTVAVVILWSAAGYFMR